MIIDFHCHAGRGDAMTAPWNTRAMLRPYLRRAAQAGISRTVLFSVFRSDNRAGNREIFRIVKQLNGRAIGFAMVHAKRDRGNIDGLIREAVKDLGLCGIKVHASEELPTRELCEAAAKWGLPVLVDVAGKAHVVDLLASEYPQVNFIVAHLGSFADDWRAHERVVEQLARYANVFADTSGVRRFDYLVRAVKRAGPEKLLFGSDGPWLHPGLELKKIRLLGLSPESEALILGGNAIRVLKGRFAAVHR